MRLDFLILFYQEKRMEIPNEYLKTDTSVRNISKRWCLLLGFYEHEARLLLKW